MNEIKLNKLLTRKQELEGEISTFKAELLKAAGSYRAGELSNRVLVMEKELEATLQSIEQVEGKIQDRERLEGSKEFEGWVKEKKSIEESCKKRTAKLAEELQRVSDEAKNILQEVGKVDKLDRKIGETSDGFSRKMAQPYAWLGKVCTNLDRRLSDWKFLGQ